MDYFKALKCLAVLLLSGTAYAATFCPSGPDGEQTTHVYNFNSGRYDCITLTSSSTIVAGTNVTVTYSTTTGVYTISSTGGGGGGGASGTINAANQFSLPYYSLSGSSNILSGFPGVTASTNTGVTVSTMSVSSFTVTGPGDSGIDGTKGSTAYSVIWSSSMASNSVGNCSVFSGTDTVVGAPCPTGSGGGSAVLSVGTGTTSGFALPSSSPTQAENFDQGQFNVSLKGGATAFITIAYSSTNVTGSYTAISTDSVIVANCASACTVTLTSSTIVYGKIFSVIQAGAGNVTVATAIGTISGGSTALMNQQYSALDIWWDKTNWWVK